MDESSQKLMTLLVNKGVIKKSQIREVWEATDGTRQGFEKYLVATQIVQKPDLLSLKSSIYHVPSIDLQTNPLDTEVARILPHAMSQRYGVICTGRESDRIVVAMIDPTDAFARDYIKMRTGFDIDLRVAYAGDLEEAQKKVYVKSGAQQASATPSAILRQRRAQEEARAKEAAPAPYNRWVRGSTENKPAPAAESRRKVALLDDGGGNGVQAAAPAAPPAPGGARPADGGWRMRPIASEPSSTGKLQGAPGSRQAPAPFRPAAAPPTLNRTPIVRPGAPSMPPPASARGGSPSGGLRQPPAEEVELEVDLEPLEVEVQDEAPAVAEAVPEPVMAVAAPAMAEPATLVPPAPPAEQTLVPALKPEARRPDTDDLQPPPAPPQAPVAAPVEEEQEEPVVEPSAGWTQAPLLGLGASSYGTTLAGARRAEGIVEVPALDLTDDDDLDGRILERLCLLGVTMSRVLNEDDLIETALTWAAEIFDVEASCLLLFHPNRKRLFFYDARGQEKVDLKEELGEDSVGGWVSIHAQPVIISGVGVDDRHCDEVDLSVGFATQTLMAVPVVVNNAVVGVLEVLNKRNNRFIPAEIRYLSLLAEQLSVALSNSDAMRQLHTYFYQSVELVLDSLASYDSNAREHVLNVAQLATAMGRELNVAPHDMERLTYSALLHDIGKMKTSSADPQHTLVGAQMLRQVQMFARLAPIVEHHHERYDGLGYPEGLQGEDIPLLSRILAVAEGYFEEGPGYDSNRALEPFLERFGTEYDPAMRQAFHKALMQG